MHEAEGRPKWAGEKDLDYWRTFIAGKGRPRSRLARAYWLWRYLGRVYAARPGVEAAGFKLMYSQLRVARPLVPALVARRARIVHLIRENALDIVVSKEAAAARTSHHAREGEAVEAVRVRVETEDLIDRLAAHELEIEKARATFARRRLPYREVTYESLVRDGEQGFAALFEFLGTEPAPEAPASGLRKVTPTSHSEVIENYEEVRGVLEGTKFAPHLH